MRRRFNVVFLDFDGVLNGRQYLLAPKLGEKIHERDDISPDAVALVNQILKRVENAGVVVSSSWRIGRKRTELCDILNARGFEGIVVGMTPTLYRSPDGVEYVRGHEIQKWLDETHYEIGSFVIIDDDTDMAHLTDRLVKTSFETGITQADVDLAVEILKIPFERKTPKRTV